MKDLSHGHFDVYLPYNDVSTTFISQSDNSGRIPSSEKHTKKLFIRFTDALRKNSSNDLLLNTTKKTQKFVEKLHVITSKFIHRFTEQPLVGMNRIIQVVNRKNNLFYELFLGWNITQRQLMKLIEFLDIMSHKYVYCNNLNFKDRWRTWSYS